MLLPIQRLRDSCVNSYSLSAPRDCGLAADSLCLLPLTVHGRGQCSSDSLAALGLRFQLFESLPNTGINGVVIQSLHYRLQQGFTGVRVVENVYFCDEVVGQVVELLAR